MQIALDTFVRGLSLALLAVAFNVVYMPTKVLHIALGGVYALVPFVAWACLDAGLPKAVAIAVALLCGGLGSLLCEVGNHARLEKRKASPLAHFLVSIGTYIIMVQGLGLVFGEETKFLSQGIGIVLPLGDHAFLTRAQIASALAVSVALVSTCLWLTKSRVGLRLRGLAENPVEFELLGQDVAWLRRLCFCLSGGLCGIVALAVAYDIGFDPHGGLGMLLLAIVATIVGGSRSLVGPALGAFLLEALRSGVGYTLGARWQDAGSYLCLCIFLLWRPGGILGQTHRLEARP